MQRSMISVPISGLQPFTRENYSETQGRLFSFEPDPGNFRLLEHNVKSNRLSNVYLLETALGETTGTADLFLSDRNHGDHRMYTEGSQDRLAIKVNVARLDELLDVHSLQKPDVIKIDVQGFDGTCLSRLGDHLRKWKRLTILTEFWPLGLRRAGSDPLDYLKMFEVTGFFSGVQ